MPRRRSATPAQQINPEGATPTSVEQTQQVGGETVNPKEKFRGELARFYVRGFIIISGGALGYTLFTGYPITDVKDILLAISGLLLGPLGFIFGFYFKDEIQNKNS